jgi:hypothetical protein
MQATYGATHDMVSAALLYNFGLINRWGGAKCHVLAAGELKEGALRLFSMSYAILAGQAVQSDPEDMCEVRLYLLLKVLNVLSQIEGRAGEACRRRKSSSAARAPGPIRNFQVVF